MDGVRQGVDLICDSEEISIVLVFESGYGGTYYGRDFYKCFASLRSDNPFITFYCKGAKINVHPSSMSSQMSLGLKAYELVAGREPGLGDLVFIFDYEEEGLANNPDEQRLFYMDWVSV
nr:hypothetical protein [Pseudomonas atagonensis]